MVTECYNPRINAVKKLEMQLFPGESLYIKKLNWQGI